MQLLPKKWKPKPKDQCVHNNCFVFQKHGQLLKATHPFCSIKHEPNDVTHFGQQKHQPKINRNSHTHDSIPDTVHNVIVHLIQGHIDAFNKEGICVLVLGMIFDINVGTAVPVATKSNKCSPQARDQDDEAGRQAHASSFDLGQSLSSGFSWGQHPSTSNGSHWDSSHGFQHVFGPHCCFEVQ